MTRLYWSILGCVALWVVCVLAVLAVLAIVGANRRRKRAMIRARLETQYPCQCNDCRRNRRRAELARRQELYDAASRMGVVGGADRDRGDVPWGLTEQQRGTLHDWGSFDGGAERARVETEDVANKSQISRKPRIEPREVPTLDIPIVTPALSPLTADSRRA